MLRLVLAFLLGIAASFFSSPLAHADDPVTCGPDMTWDGQKCQVMAASPGQSAAALGDSPGKGGGRTQPRTCAFGSIPMPCTNPDLGWWSAARSCYVQRSNPQPPMGAPMWAGHTDGAIYDCALPRAGVFGGGYMFWSATAPAGPDPEVLAQQAIASMNLRPISIGIVPEDRPGSVGLVGMPVWLWADSPDAQSWGPITRTASASGVTVTATAKVQRVRWQMGDGAVVVCGGKGTVYEDRFGKADSPTCGYTYRKQGTYTVRAESQWSVAWSGMGASGTIPVLLTDSTTITIGELQVITTG